MHPNGSDTIEIRRAPEGRRFRSALFDFDGTISLIREGWPQVMIPMMVEVLAPVARGRAADEIRALVTEDVRQSTGKQTIYQMIQLAQRVTEFGGTPLDPPQYKAEYNRRLMRHIAGRREALAAGRTPPDALLLRGARAMLEALAARGLALYAASGTDQPDVREEAGLLDIARYFGPHVYGSLEDYEASSKRKVIERLIAQNRIAGSDLVVFGDGFVEIENAKEVGGYAVGVASDEAAGGGRINPWKRQRLLDAGADLIVPDFAEHATLIEILLGKM
jgi:phosphoglycolate phosphatase-like HAD superfamily hydrolase